MRALPRRANPWCQGVRRTGRTLQYWYQSARDFAVAELQDEGRTARPLMAGAVGQTQPRGVARAALRSEQQGRERVAGVARRHGQGAF